MAKHWKIRLLLRRSLSAWSPPRILPDHVKYILPQAHDGDNPLDPHGAAGMSVARPGDARGGGAVPDYLGRPASLWVRRRSAAPVRLGLAAVPVSRRPSRSPCRVAAERRSQAAGASRREHRG